ncbi:DMT family transporter [Nonomuraea sp. NPDC050783]|uniref:DMT family transporter n=1 Tax=Nonomuraea sp. NPDC050783 TaxID=3154634 RepID=UPI0034650FE5
MEANFRWALVTAIAPVAWGANYYVTREFLPPEYPLYGAAVRALPAGLLLLAVTRALPRGSWWWKSLVLGTLNMSAFFALVYVAAQTLPTSLASMIMATSPVMMMLLAWLLLSERPGVLPAAGAVIGVGGVCLMLLAGTTAAGALGVAASVAAMAMSSLGAVLGKRWGTGAGVLAMTSWQLVAGGVVLLPFAVAVEGPPPAVTGPVVLGFGYVTVIATALAFAAWFAGLRHLPAATVGLVGLLNPVTGVLLGTMIAGEGLTARQAAGLALAFTGIVLGQPVVARLTGRRRPAAGTQPTPVPVSVPGRAGRPPGPKAEVTGGAAGACPASP